MTQDKINFFIPLEIEKAQDEKGKEKMLIKGIASTSDKDSDEEELTTKGFDLSYLKRYGFLNWHHQAKGTPAAVIGEPTKAELTPKGLYIEGELYPDSKLAREVYSLAQLLEKSGSSRHLGFSIEGNVLERGSKDEKHPDFKKILKSQITGVAITHMPKNNNTLLSIMKGQYDNGFEEVEFEVIEKGEKGETNLIVDIHDEELDQRITVDKDLNLKIEKGGEGSRGGKVIGHTKSGKPIYEKSHNLPLSDYSKQDHLDAADAHAKAAEHHQISISAKGKSMSFNEKKERKALVETHEQNSKGHIERSKTAKEESKVSDEVEKSITSSSAGAIAREDLEGATHNVSEEDRKKKEKAMVTIVKAHKEGQIDDQEFERIKNHLQDNK